jgi:hypothetical protein
MRSGGRLAAVRRTSLTLGSRHVCALPDSGIVGRLAGDLAQGACGRLMRGTLTKVDDKRYKIAIEHQHGPALVPRFGPGNDDLMPHDLAHYLIDGDAQAATIGQPKLVRPLGRGALAPPHRGRGPVLAYRLDVEGPNPVRRRQA